MIEFRSLLQSLGRNKVAFVIVGGVAAALHGSARVTFDLDIVYDREPENLERLVSALAPLSPYLRGAPAGLPFRFDVDTLKRGLNFTLTTSDGAIDLLGEVGGVGSYDTARQHCESAELFGGTYDYLDLDTLILAKRAAGRPKDFEALAELEAIRDERNASS